MAQIGCILFYKLNLWDTLVKVLFLINALENNLKCLTLTHTQTQTQTLEKLNTFC